MSDEQVKVDALVVGAGPAGISAALCLARRGLEVVVVERGESAGAKNMGGLLYGTVLNRLIPNFHEQAPVERAVTRRRIVFLGPERQLALDFGSEAWGRAPFNHTWTVHRPAFDRWFAGQAEAAGAGLVEGTVVERVLLEGEGAARRAVGVQLRGEEQFRADVVLLADGAHGLVGQAACRELGMAGPKPQHFALGVKETIGLPAGVIEDRFGLEPGQGAAIDFIGAPFENLIGGGFIYTQKETVSLGFAGRLESLQKAGLEPGDVLERFKQHPEVRRYLRGGELLEYSAHMIPEGGIDCLPRFAGNGALVLGDAAGLVNMSLYKEGTNHAMFSGTQAAEAVLEARERGDFSRAGLASYERRMAGSAALADLRKYRELPRILESTPELLGLYPDRVSRLLVDYFTVTEDSKADLQKRALREFFQGLSKLKLVRDLLRARKLL
ncbi:MAG: FAD-dependent oxidoreductase [Candidatus Delongbacteria bacterium]